jgi:hypothetical protein
LYDADAFDLESGLRCEGGLGADCFVEPDDFWISFDAGTPNLAILVPVLGCADPTRTVGVAVLGTPYANVLTLGPYIGSLQDNVLEASFGVGEAILLRTCDLRYYKIGPVEIGADRATFAYEELF